MVVNAYEQEIGVYFHLEQTTGNAYMGNLHKGSRSVQLSPPLRVSVDPQISLSGKICGFHAIGKGENFPFNVDLVNAAEGLGEVRVRPDVDLGSLSNDQFVFHIEAYDCDNPPHYSQRVLVEVTSQNNEDVKFTQDDYKFFTVTYSPVGSIVGKVTILNAPQNSDPEGLGRCGYSIRSGDMVPFTIDSQGVLRVSRVLTSSSPRAFRFQVQFTDCLARTQMSKYTTVEVELIQTSCQSKWEGLPQKIDVNPNRQRPERLLWPPTFSLHTCGEGCVNPTIQAELSLHSTRPDLPLVTATTPSCQHDPESLNQQRKLCDVNPDTIVNLLPSTNTSLDMQLIPPSIGAPPEVLAVSSALRFDASAHTVWRVDAEQLRLAARAHQLRLTGDSFLPPVEDILPSNLFERDFTFSFWLRRRRQQRQGMRSSMETTDPDEYETVLCSQEDSAVIVRALLIAFKNCYLMMQMSTRDTRSNQADKKAFRTFYFPQLPENVCDPNRFLEDEQWHHYAISVSIDSSYAEVQTSTLLVDGEEIGTLTELNETITFQRPTQKQFSQFITIGSCLDPSTRRAQQSLNGDLAGVQLLLGQNEDHSVSRCLSQCGETLLLPKASELLNSGGGVLLTSSSITVTTDQLEQMVNLLSHIAYVGPNPNDNKLMDVSATDSLERELQLLTTYMCDGAPRANISVARIPLYLAAPFPRPSWEAVPSPPAAAYPVETVDLPDKSLWLPKDEVEDTPADRRLDRQETRARTPNRPPAIGVIGVNTITADIPVTEPGLPMFQELKFTLINVNGGPNGRSAERVASSVLLDECIVIPVSARQLNISAGEQIVWQTSRGQKLGIRGESDAHGVRLKGRLTAGQYASLLHSFRYWPPMEVDRPKEEPASQFVWIAKFELICSYDHLSENTQPFIIKLLMRLPQNAEDLNAPGGSQFEEVPNEFDRGNFDYDDDNDFQAHEPLRGTEARDGAQKLHPSAPYLQKVRPGYPVHYSHSDKEVRSGDTLRLVKAGDKVEKESQSSGINVVGLSVTLTICALSIIVLVVGFMVRNTNVCRRYRPALFGKKKHRSRGVGRLEFRPETRFNVTENPLENLENGQMNWKSESRLPGVHRTFGAGTSSLANQQTPADEQFDAETRSFDGLFEDEDTDAAGAFPEADLEEVDDFEESEAAIVHAGGVPRAVPEVVDEEEAEEGEEEEDEASDQEGAQSYGGVGPSHLEFITLPKSRSSFQRTTDTEGEQV